MKTFCLLCLTGLLATYNANAQQIIGRVTDKSGRGLEGASISLIGTADGATADSTGRFRFGTASHPPYRLTVSYIGYKTTTADASAGSEIKIVMGKDPSTLQPVVISAGAFSAGDKNKGAVMTAMDVVSVAGNGGDVANAARTLPGAQQIGEREGLFVRGGAGSETRQFVDGTLVPSPYFASMPGLPQFNRISSPFLFDGIVFSTGGYSAAYGQGLSGALILETQDLPEKSSAVIGISPMVAVAGVQKLAKNGRSSLGLSTRYMTWHYYAKAVPQNPEYATGPAYSITEANYRQRTGKTGMLKVYANFGYHQAELYREDIDSAALLNRFASTDRNLYLNISHRSRPGKNYRLDLGAALNYNSADISRGMVNRDKTTTHPEGPVFAGKFSEYRSRERSLQGKAVLTRYFEGGHLVLAGAEAQIGEMDELYAGFAEGEWRLHHAVALRTGARWEYSRLSGKGNIAPRVSLAVRTGTYSQINAAYGIYYQQAERRWRMEEPSLPQAKASHYILNYTRKENGRIFRAEGFYKQYDRLLKTYPSTNMSGSGYANGLEMFWRDKKSVPNFDYWISYSYLHTRRDHLDYPLPLQPDFAAPHTLSVVAKRFFEKISTNVNVSWSLAAGRPYYDFTPDHQIRQQGTTRAYNVVNLGFAHMLSLFPKWKQKDFTVIASGINNVLGTRQVFGYDFSYNGQTKSPITLPATRNYFIGIFMSLGIDRTEDYLNDNL
ncbi:TonB-dependent receptor [Chitinophaga deserti]|uniref:TonB-dependent receptor n=1 Tax=Chitinophaga deserti TaxID=2164099 RepID=UPI000D6CD153|nr:TonB-dependent receptor [Chitinophaga deserti]